MRCIFCKVRSDSSRSREHILPESLGNADHVLPAGVVCDSCNNYFARKLEKPVLESPTFQHLRLDMQLKNKRSRLPTPAAITSDRRPLPDYRLMGRFLGKVALEILAQRTAAVDGWNDEIVDKPELDELRSFVRRNVGQAWPFSFRTLYPVNALFQEENQFFEVLHEYQLFYTARHELYAVIAILGVELAINLGGPELDGYMAWLQANDEMSPLYMAAPSVSSAGA